MTDQQPPEVHTIVPSLLIPEILGYSPQLLLDDIIDVANEIQLQAVEGMDHFLQRWADERVKSSGGEWDSTEEVEGGIIAFQTLLQEHTDIAFDFFEAWSLRNIFAVPPDLPFVMRHHENLDLEQPPGREAELCAELDELRRKINVQRQLRRMYKLALLKSHIQRRRAEARRDKVSVLASPTLDILSSLPPKLLAMYDSVQSLPELNPSEMTQLNLTDPGKRKWETSKSGYLNWAVEQLLAKRHPGVTPGIDVVHAETRKIASTADLKAASEKLG